MLVKDLVSRGLKSRSDLFGVAIDSRLSRRLLRGDGETLVGTTGLGQHLSGTFHAVPWTPFRNPLILQRGRAGDFFRLPATRSGVGLRIHTAGMQNRSGETPQRAIFPSSSLIAGPREADENLNYYFRSS